MTDIFNVYKPLGWTPLEAVLELKNKFPELHEQSITYAGRLDPMAEGVLILLKGSAIEHKKDFLNLDKSYTATIIFGLETDTYDILGISRLAQKKVISKEEVEIALDKFKGKQSLGLPPFSSPVVKGKPLFQWSRNNELDQIEIPEKEFNIADIRLKESKKTNWNSLLKEIEQKIELVHGDFRQKEILEVWKKLPLKESGEFNAAVIDIQCSSGTYIRSIAYELGKRLGTSAILSNLIRTRVGNYTINEAMRLI